MTPILALVPTLLAPLQQGPQAAPNESGLKRITLEQTLGRGELPAPRLSTELPRWRWAPDGEHVVLSSRRKETEQWVNVRTGADGKPKDASTDDEAAKDAIGELRGLIEQAVADGDLADRSQKQVARIAEVLATRAEQTSDDGEARMAYIGKALWFYSPKTGARVVARDRDGEIRYDRLSGDGKWITFVRDNDLYIVDTSNGRTRKLTSGGGPDQFNGVLDWVYQEEIYGRGDFQAHFWSPSSKHTAYIALDESPVHEFTVVDHIESGHFRVEPEVTNYPKVGDPNPIPSVGIVNVEQGATAWVDLSRYDGTEILIVRVGWTPYGERCLVHVQDRIQTWAELLSVDPETGKGDVLIRETSDAWTERPEPPIWLTDGTFLWHSHRTGTMHLYHYAQDGKLLGAVTKGDWNLLGVEHVEELPREGEDGPLRARIWFRSTEGGDINSNHYRIDLDGSGFTRLTHGDGSHSVSFNDDRSMFIDRYSSLTDPGRVVVRDADGKELRQLSVGHVPAAEEYALGKWELHEVTTKDGVTLDAAVLKPHDFDPSRSYAVWVDTYSGPAAPSVRNRWSASSFFHFLAQNGVIVLRANVRTATSRGPVHTAALYRRVGLQEVSDMVEVVDWLTANPWADGSRVGITGYSFGGSMTANCLLRTDRFKLGIAGGGVYDWRMYDTIYTERYMRTPADNLSGYEATSIFAQAGNLREGTFLHMHHGIMDDNVHVQNMFQMSHALMKAGKSNWSMTAYPQTRHGIRDRDLAWHARVEAWRLIQEHLLGDG